MAFLLQTLHRLSVVDSQARADHGRSDSLRRWTSPPGRSIRSRTGCLSKHVKTVFRLWVIVFALVGAQMGWVLRPFVGNPNMPFTWFRAARVEFLPGCLPTFVSLFS